MLRTLGARVSRTGKTLGIGLGAVAMLAAVTVPQAAFAQPSDPFGAAVGGSFGSSYVTSPVSQGDLLPSYNFGPSDSMGGSADVSALTGGRPVITYTLSGAYCTLANAEQVWVPAGASTDAMGCGRAAITASTGG